MRQGFYAVYNDHKKVEPTAGGTLPAPRSPAVWGMGDTGRACFLPHRLRAVATVEAGWDLLSRATQLRGFQADWRLRKV